VDSRAAKIVYKLIETDEPAMSEAEPELPMPPRRPKRTASDAEWDAYDLAVEEYLKAEEAYDAWIDRVLGAQGNEPPADDARWNEYVSTHQGHLMPGAKLGWNPPKREPLPGDEPIPLADKMKYAVFEWGNFVFIKMPPDHAFIRREGIDMNHCLEFDYKRYADRLRSGAQLQFSMVDKRDEKPKVDTEVSLTKASYARNKITQPVVTQIRGLRNQCPPADEYIEPLIRFYETVGPNWKLTGHGVQNFDGECDGDKLVRRWREMQAEGKA